MPSRLLAEVVDARVPDRDGSSARLAGAAKNCRERVSALEGILAALLATSRTLCTRLEASLLRADGDGARLDTNKRSVARESRGSEDHGARAADHLAERLGSLQQALLCTKASRSFLETAVQLETLRFKVATSADTSLLKQALQGYASLYDCWLSIGGPNADTAGSCDRLFRAASRMLTQSFDDLRLRLSRRLSQASQQIGWPSVTKMQQFAGDLARGQTVDGANAAFRDSFTDLLAFQRPYVPKPRAMVRTISSLPVDSDHEPIMALGVLAEPLAVRLRYHFCGSRPTNRLDKPEWMYHHVAELVREHKAFLTQVVQPMLNATGLARVDAKNEFVFFLLVPVAERIRTDMALLLKQSQLVPHYVHETLLFDDLMRTDFAYRPIGTSQARWEGLGAQLTGDRDWFEAWVRIEKTGAMEALSQTLRGSQEGSAWERASSVDQAASDELRPSRSSDELVLLIEGLASRFILLPDFRHRLYFVNEVVLVLLADYLEDVLREARELVNLSGPVFSISATESVRLDGAGVTAVCRWIGSLEHLSSAMHDWGESLPYLELWSHLVNEAPHAAHSNVTASVFSGVGAQYEDATDRLYSILGRGITNTVARALRPYLRKRSWSRANAGEDSDATDDEVPGEDPGAPPAGHGPLAANVSPELSRPLSLLAELLAVCDQNLGTRGLSAVVGAVERGIENLILHEVVERHHFGDAGANQLSVDFQSGIIAGVFGKYQRGRTATFPRLRHALSQL